MYIIRIVYLGYVIINICIRGWVRVTRGPTLVISYLLLVIINHNSIISYYNRKIS